MLAVAAALVTPTVCDEQADDRGHQVARSQSFEPGVALVEQGGQPSNRQVDELLDGRLAQRGRAGEDAVVDTSRPLVQAPHLAERVWARTAAWGERSIGVELSMKF